MTLLDSLRKRFQITKNLSNSLGIVTRNYGRASRFQPVRQVTGITYKAIDKIGLSLSVYEPLVKRSNGDAYVNHPLLNIYNQPNPNVQSASDFIHLYGMLFEIYGETFWYKAKGETSRKVKEVYLLAPDRMELKIHEGELIGYVLHKSNGSQVPFLPEEIYHDKRPNPFNEWRGLSVLEKAATYVDTEIATSNFTLNYISNSGSPSGIVTLPDMEKEAFKLFTSQWREAYEGPENAGKTAFIRGGEAKFEAVGSTLKDIDQKVTREMAKEDVLMMLDVPRELLGWTKDNGFGRNTFEAAYYVYAHEKLEPMMRRLDRIYEHLAKEVTNGQPVDISHMSPVPEDKEHKLKRMEKGVNVWMTVNEARALDGLEPIKNGDELMPENAIKPAPTKALRIVKKKKPTKAEIAKKLNDEQEAFRKGLVETNDIYSARLKTEISRFADRQGKEVISRINASSKAYEEWLFSIREESEVLAATLTPIVIELMEAQGEGVANFITGELLTIAPEMRATVETNVKQVSGIFNQETISALEKTLSEGQTAGESLVKLKHRVEKVYSDASGYRAERIARTESLKASNATAQEVYKQNGYSSVQWFINPGACEFCRTFAGRVKDISATFNSIGDVITSESGNQLRIEHDDIGTPPLHPNCTCSLVPVE
jgi:HK97 family phage portal protein